MIASLEFYGYQILAGMALAAVASLVGVVVVVRRQSVLALTMSQCAALGSLFAVVLGASSDWISISLAMFVALPLLGWHAFQRSPRESHLVAAFVILAALGHLAMSGLALESHLTQIYFGDILTTTEATLVIALCLLAVLMLCLVVFYPRIASIIHDQDQLLLNHGYPVITNVLLLTLTLLAIAFVLNALGMIATIAAVVLPPLAVLGFSRSLRVALVAAPLVAVTATAAGFLLSLIPIESEHGTSHLPTTGAIVVALAVACLPVVGVTLKRRLPRRGAR